MITKRKCGFLEWGLEGGTDIMGARGNNRIMFLKCE